MSIQRSSGRHLTLEDIYRSAVHVGNGEAFWSLSVAVLVAEDVAGRGVGILGGEVYVPQGRAWGNLEREWLTTPSWRDGEEWSAYVARGLEQARSAIVDAQTALGNEARASRGEPRCFLAYHADDDHRSSVGQRVRGGRRSDQGTRGRRADQGTLLSPLDR